MRHFAAFLILLALFTAAANSVQAADSAAGKAVYDRLCVPCHGPNGVGASGPPMNTVAFGQKYNSAAKLGDITRRGAPGMPAYGAELLTDADLANLVAYIDGLVPAGYVTPAPVRATPGSVTNAPGSPPANAASQTDASQSLPLEQIYAIAVIALAAVNGVAMAVIWLIVNRRPSG